MGGRIGVPEIGEDVWKVLFDGAEEEGVEQGGTGKRCARCVGMEAIFGTGIFGEEGKSDTEEFVEGFVIACGY